MRKTLPLTMMVAALLLVASTAYAAITFRAFSLRNLGGRVEVSWTTGQERDCTEFVVERSTDGLEYHPIATGISPHGPNLEYRYIDSSVFKEKTSTYYYRVLAKTTLGDGTYTRSEEIQVDSNGFQRSWGGLKAMFR